MKDRMSSNPLFLAVVCTFIVLAFLAGALALHADQTKDSQRRLDAVAECLKQSTAELRQVTRDTLNDLRTAHGLDPIPPNVFTPPVPDNPAACDKVVRRGVVPPG